MKPYLFGERYIPAIADVVQHEGEAGLWRSPNQNIR
jgi:hypothetical protein